MSRVRSYSEMQRLFSFEERFEYLSLGGEVGRSTFGFDRYINQQFYSSRQWKQVRDRVITRDMGLDLGVEGHEIHDRIIIHHLNPMRVEDIEVGDPMILDLDNLITTTHKTHNAIHYGDARLLPQSFPERRPGDTKLW